MRYNWGNFGLFCLGEVARKTFPSEFWYLINSNCRFHAEFMTTEAMMRWVDERNLHLVQGLPPKKGDFRYIYIDGVYREDVCESRREYEEGTRAHYNMIRVLSHGVYTQATSDFYDGIVTIRYCGHEVEDRIVHDLEESQARYL